MAALGIHQHAIGGERVALPFVPQADAPSAGVRAVAPLEHQPLDIVPPCGCADFRKRFPIARLNQRRGVEDFRGQIFRCPEQPLAALGERKRAHVLLPVHQNVVEPHEGRVLAQQFGVHGLAVQPLLQGVEGGRIAVVSPHQQLAVQCALNVQVLDDLGEGCGNVVSRAGVEPLHVARFYRLHADAVPFPLGKKLAKVQRLVIFQRR